MKVTGAQSIARTTRLGYLAAAGVFVCGVLVALGLTAGARADLMTLTVEVSPTSVTVPSAAGGTIAAGCYDVAVSNSYPLAAGDPDQPGNGPAPQFTIYWSSGVLLPPNDLNSTGMGEDGNLNFGPYVFQSGVTYTVADKTSNSSVSFTAQGSGSTSCATSSSGPVDVSSTPSTTTTTIVPTAPKVTSTIDATVSATGSPSLVLGGHSVKTLKPGLYTIVIEDHSKKAGLIVGEGSKKRLSLSGGAFVGKVTHSVTFSAGTWYFESTASRSKSSFVVS